MINGRLLKFPNPIYYFASAAQVVFTPDGGITLKDGIALEDKIIDLENGLTYLIKDLQAQADENNYTKPLFYIYEIWNELKI